MKINRIKIWVLLLALLQVFVSVPMTVFAAETHYGYEITVDPTYTAIGSEATVTLQLTDYTDKKSGIRGFQVDIQNVGNLLNGARCYSLVEDAEDVLVNTAAYQSEKDILRQVYARENGTLPYEQTQLLEIKIPIPDNGENMGSYKLPIRLLIQNEIGAKLAYEDEIIIQYASEEMLRNTIVVEADKTDLVQGEVAKLSAQILPQNLTGTKINWKLEDGAEQFATIKINKDNSVSITAKAVTELQTIKVTACADDDSVAPYDQMIRIHPKAEMVRIYQDSLEGESVSGKNLYFDLNKASTMQLVAAVYPGDAGQGVSWKSSNTKIADIDPDSGLVTFKSVAGTVKFSATTKDGSKKTDTVSVQTIFVPDNLEKEFTAQEGRAEISLVGGQSVNLRIADRDTNKYLTNKQITWELAEEYAPFATVSAAGKLTTKKVLAYTVIEAIGRLVGSDVVFVYTIEIYPAVTAVEIVSYQTSLSDHVTVTNQTIPFDFEDESLNLEAVLHPGDALGKEVTWSISDSTKRTFAENYSINGNFLVITGAKGKAGTVTIKATSNDGSKKTATVKVAFGSFAKDISIEGPEELYEGTSAQLTAVTEPQKPTKVGVTWSLKNADDKNYVTLSSKGKITAKTIYAEREITVVATSKDGMAQTEKTIHLIPKNERLLILKRDDVNVTKSTIYIDSNTESYIILTAHNFGNDENVSIKQWKTSDKKIATVDENGVVTFVENKKGGSVTITAVAEGGRQATVTLKVSKLASQVQINGRDSDLEVASGKTLKLTAAVMDAANSKVTWSIVDGDAYAKIASTGTLTATPNLTRSHVVKVRATAADGSGVMDEADITIRPIAQGVQVYSLEQNFSIDSNERVRSNTSLILDVTNGLEMDLYAHVYPYYGEDDSRNAMQAVTWKSSNAQIVEVDKDNGHISAVWDAKKQTYKTGTVTITATATDGSGKSVSFKITLQKWISDFEMADQVVAGGKSVNLAKALLIMPSDATNKKITWSITGGDGEAYATISSAGALKAKTLTAAKSVIVTVAAQDNGGYTESFEVLLYPVTTNVNIYSGERNVTGEKITITTEQMLILRGVSLPDDAADSFAWTSSKTSIATVSEVNGNVTVMPVRNTKTGKYNTGEVTITCTATDGSGKKASMKVKITAAP